MQLGNSRNGWRLVFSPAAGQQLGSGWHATSSQSGQTVTAASLDWNAAIPAGGSVSLGIVVNGDAALPSSFTLNGSACS